MLVYAFGIDWKRSGYYLFAVGSRLPGPRDPQALTPLGQPVGNKETMGIGLLLNIYQHGMFPSGHTCLTAVIFFLIDRDRTPRLKIATGILCVIEMVCLLLSHAHYSIDLVGGLMVAFITKSTGWTVQGPFPGIRAHRCASAAKKTRGGPRSGGSAA